MVTTVRETVNGQLFVGLGEGFVLGIAYAVCGFPHPLLLGALTVVLAIIPFGAPLLVATVSLVLVIQSNTIQAFGLLVFGSVVFLAEHFFRPLLIGSSARLSFIWVLLGIFGGLSAFGLIGLFLGPAILAASIALWRELATPSVSLGASVRCMMSHFGPKRRFAAVQRYVGKWGRSGSRAGTVNV